jgi:hypothetical protein
MPWKQSWLILKYYPGLSLLILKKLWAAGNLITILMGHFSNME